MALAVVSALGVAAAPSRADSLLHFINDPTTIVAPPLSFTGVPVISTVLTGGATFNADNVIVTPILVSPLGPGLNYQTSEFHVTSGQSMDVTFSYKVTSSGTAIEDNSMTIVSGAVFGTGSITITESVFADAAHTIPLANVLVAVFDGVNHNFDQKFFAPTTGPIYVVKDISLVGGTLGSAAFSNMTQNFSLVTPEPTTMASAFLGLALFGGGFWLRRRNVKV